MATLIKNGKMNIDELAIIKNNLTLSEEQSSYITELQNYTLSQIQALTDTEIESLEDESDIYLRYVLSTMTGLQYLSLKNISNLTDIDWVNKVTGLKGLDLYGVSATDLSLLETKGLELKDMRINNPNIELSDIQATISRCTGGSFGGTVATSVEEGTGFEAMSYGCIIYGDELLNKLSTCTELTAWYYWCHGAYSSSDYTLDLTNCTNLKNLDVCRGIDGIIKLPASLEYTRLEDVGFYKVDFSQAASLKTLIMSACNYNAEGLDELATDLAYYDSIESITIGIYEKGDWNYIDWIDKFKTCSNLKELDISRYRHTWEGSYGDMSKLTMPSCLVTLNLGYMGITKLPDLSLCKNLENLYIDRNSIEDLDFATSLPALKNLIANDNKIISIAGIRNCKQLESINLENNFIYDNSYTTENEKTRAYNNCSILAELYESNLRQLFLKGNYIDDFAPIINLGWEEENKSGF